MYNRQSASVGSWRLPRMPRRLRFYPRSRQTLVVYTSIDKKYSLIACKIFVLFIIWVFFWSLIEFHCIYNVAISNRKPNAAATESQINIFKWFYLHVSSDYCHDLSYNNIELSTVEYVSSEFRPNYVPLWVPFCKWGLNVGQVL